MGARAFSSGPVLAFPSFRASFVLRDGDHIKSEVVASPDRYAHASQLPGLATARELIHKANRRSSE